MEDRVIRSPTWLPGWSGLLGSGLALLDDERRERTDPAIVRLNDRGDHSVVGSPPIGRHGAPHISVMVVLESQVGIVRSASECRRRRAIATAADRCADELGCHGWRVKADVIGSVTTI
jgi:hypothetical protein